MTNARTLPPVNKGKVWAFLVLLVVAIGVWFSIYSIPQSARLPVIAQVPEWTLINEAGRPFGSRDLVGKVYLANFVFSRCPSVCPKMLKDTVELQKKLEPLGTKVALTSFTVDPDFDQPAVLAKVARDYQANPKVWSFLTSEDKAGLLKLYNEGFKIGVSEARPIGDLFDIAHSERIVLVDQESRIRGFYSYTPESLQQLVADATELAGQ